MSAKPVTEAELRHWLRARLAERAHATGARVFEELQIELGAARVDLALVGEQLQGYELKSDLDDFGRLHNQIHAYNRVFDTITLVTGPVHAAAALAITPSWWGVTRMERDEAGALVAQVLREPSTHTAQQPASLAMFLWRDEAVGALQKEAVPGLPKRATRSQLHERLASSVSLDRLRAVVTDALTTRKAEAATERPQSRRDDDSSHPAASCWDSRFQL